jgi:hypothetical protein
MVLPEDSCRDCPILLGGIFGDLFEINAKTNTFVYIRPRLRLADRQVIGDIEPGSGTDCLNGEQRLSF